MIKIKKIDGFNAQEGFILFEQNNKIVGISSGWRNNDDLMIYTKNKHTGEWKGDWYNPYYDDEFPISDAIELKDEWDRNQEFKEAVKDARNTQDLYVGEDLDICDVIPGEKSNNGGEYGFYSYYKKTDEPGVYEYETSTTCDFDSCGTGWKGYVVLTNEDAENLLKNDAYAIEQQESQISPSIDKNIENIDFER